MRHAVCNEADKFFAEGERIAAIDDDMAGIKDPEYAVEHITDGCRGILQRREIDFRLAERDFLKLLHKLPVILRAAAKRLGKGGKGQ